MLCEIFGLRRVELYLLMEKDNEYTCKVYGTIVLEYLVLLHSTVEYSVAYRCYVHIYSL
jgi:hypothetical protein